MNETHTTQPFGPFFPLIFTVAKWICRLLHPVTVQGLENLPSHGALLVANHASNWDPLVLATALPMDYRLRVMGKEELFQNPILAWVIRVGGAFPVNRGGADIQAVKTAIQTIQSGQNLLIFPEGTTVRNGIGKADRDPQRNRLCRRPARPRQGRGGHDRRADRSHYGAGVCGRRKADLPPDTHHHRPALYAGIYRPPGDC